MQLLIVSDPRTIDRVARSDLSDSRNFYFTNRLLYCIIEYGGQIARADETFLEEFTMLQI